MVHCVCNLIMSAGDRAMSVCHLVTTGCDMAIPFCDMVLTVQVERHLVDGQMKNLLVHRKGATRAFAPHHPLIPVDYQTTGQPVRVYRASVYFL